MKRIAMIVGALLALGLAQPEPVPRPQAFGLQMGTPLSEAVHRQVISEG
jgi:hypothetical protein